MFFTDQTIVGKSYVSLCIVCICLYFLVFFFIISILFCFRLCGIGFVVCRFLIQKRARRNAHTESRNPAAVLLCRTADYPLLFFCSVHSSLYLFSTLCLAVIFFPIFHLLFVLFLFFANKHQSLLTTVSAYELFSLFFLVLLCFSPLTLSVSSLIP